MGSPSYMWSVVDRYVITRRIPVQISWALRNLSVVMCAVWSSAGSPRSPMLQHLCHFNLSLLFCMGAKLGLAHCGRNIG